MNFGRITSKLSFLQLTSSNYLATDVKWPLYSLVDPRNIVFDANTTSLAYNAPDIYRAEAIDFMTSTFFALGR